MPSRWDRIKGFWLDDPQKRALTANDALRGLWAGVQTSTGLRVDEKTSLQVIAVFNAVKILTEGFAQIPLKVYRRTPDGRDEARQNPMYGLLHDQPNERMTAFGMHEFWMMSLALWGNSYTEIIRNNRNEVMELWPINPSSCKAERTRDGRIVYRVRINQDPYGYTASADDVVLPESAVLHIRGFSLDGFTGISPISQIRENVGLSSAYQEYAARFFGNGAVPGFVLSTDRPMQQPAIDAIQKEWADKYQGVQNASKLAVLHSGLTPQKIGIPPDDAQFIESRQFEREEIMSFYRIPPNFYAADKVSSWGSGIESMANGFIKFSLDPWFVRVEQALTSKFLSQNAQGPLFAEFDREGFLRGDFQQRNTVYKMGRDGGWYSVNDIRRLENLPGIGTSGDIYLIPANMVPADKIEAIADKAAAPDPVPVVAPAQPQTDNAAARMSLIVSQRPMFLEAVDRVLRRATYDIGQAREKKSPEDFERWMTDFAVDHRAFAVKYLGSVVSGLAEVIRSDVSREIGTAVPDFPNFTLLQLEQLAERVAVASESADALVGAELIQLSNNFSEMAYRALRVNATEPAMIDGAPVLIVNRYVNKPEPSGDRLPQIVVNAAPLPALAPPQFVIENEDGDAINTDVDRTLRVLGQELRREAEMKPAEIQAAIKAGMGDSVTELTRTLTAFMEMQRNVNPQAPTITLVFPQDAIKVEVKAGDVYIQEGAIKAETPVTVNMPDNKSKDKVIEYDSLGRLSTIRDRLGSGN